MALSTAIVNRALQCLGTRTTVTDLELQTGSTNEAIQANLVVDKLRDELMRMAPWNCGTNVANLVLITAATGTPENQSPGTTLWQKGTPYPPWAYEYQWPVDCLRPLYIIPQQQTGFSGGVPITTAVTGGAPAFWQGPPVKFKVAVDQFFTISAATVATPGSGYAVGDVITLAIGPVTSPPIGAPAQLLVLTLSGSGVATVGVVNDLQFLGPSPAGGNYITIQPNPQSQGSTTGLGTGATFNLTFFPIKVDRRIILTNQEFATLCYMRIIDNPDVMDQLFVDAWSNILASRLCMALTGDKTLANMCIQNANNMVMEARKADGNEGLTVNDVTPDWIRTRGIDFSTSLLTGPYSGFDWGNVFPLY